MKILNKIIAPVLSFIEYGKQLNRKKLKIYREAKRAFFLKTVNFLLRNRKGYITPTKENTKSVAIVMINCGLGDAIVTSGMIKVFRDHGIKVNIIGDKRNVAIFKNLVKVDKFYSETELMFKFWVRFDATMSFFIGHHRNAIACMKAKLRSGCMIGYSSPYPELFDYNFTFTGHEHFSLMCERVLKEVFPFLEYEKYSYAINLEKACLESAHRFLEKEHIAENSKIIVINQKASDKLRSLSDETMKKLVSELSAANKYEIVLLNISDSDLYKNINHVHINDLKSFSEVVALISFSSFLITTDTSFVHVGNALDIDAIGIYNNRGEGCFCNNIVWGPNYKKALQIFSTENVGTGNGDDLRKIDYSIIHNAIKSKCLL